MLLTGIHHMGKVLKEEYYHLFQGHYKAVRQLEKYTKEMDILKLPKMP